MNWYKTIKEAAIRARNYGYWVGPNGEDYAVEAEMAHAAVAREIGYAGYDDAFQSGMIRVLTSDGECGCDGRKLPNEMQISTLTKIFNEAICQNAIWVELGSMQIGVEPRAFANRVKSMLAKLSSPEPSIQSSPQKGLSDTLEEDHELV